METSEKDISKEEFLALCLKYAGPNTVAYWTDFLSKDSYGVKKEDWKFVVTGEAMPVPPKVFLDVATRVWSHTIAAFFATEDDIGRRYGNPED